MLIFWVSIISVSNSGCGCTFKTCLHRLWIERYVKCLCHPLQGTNVYTLQNYWLLELALRIGNKILSRRQKRGLSSKNTEHWIELEIKTLMEIEIGKPSEGCEIQVWTHRSHHSNWMKTEQRTNILHHLKSLWISVRFSPPANLTILNTARLRRNFIECRQNILRKCSCAGSQIK